MPGGRFQMQILSDMCAIVYLHFAQVQSIRKPVRALWEVREMCLQLGLDAVCYYLTCLREKVAWWSTYSI